MKKIVLFLAIISMFLIGCENPETTTGSEAPSSTTQQEPTVDGNKVTIKLVAGQKGLYGEWFTINKDTELEESYYVYRVPAGTYTVTNTGEYMDQFNVYGDTVYITDSGWEELSNCIYVKLFKQGESDTVTIDDGQIIEIHGKGTWELVLN